MSMNTMGSKRISLIEVSKYLIDYLVYTTINRGNKPTFDVSNWQEVNDVTLAYQGIADLIKILYVSEEIPMSDHKLKDLT